MSWVFALVSAEKVRRDELLAERLAQDCGRPARVQVFQRGGMAGTPRRVVEKKSNCACRKGAESDGAAAVSEMEAQVGFEVVDGLGGEDGVDGLDELGLGDVEGFEAGGPWAAK